MKFYTITSPIKGKVFNLKPTSPGFVVNQTDQEPLLTIVPVNTFIAKILIPNEKIGFVSIGQEATVRVNAYQFTEYGSIKGKLVLIGNEALKIDSNKSNSFFPGEVSLEKQFLEKNDRQYNLLSGQTVQVNLVVKEKRVITLLTDVITRTIDSLRSVRSSS